MLEKLFIELMVQSCAFFFCPIALQNVPVCDARKATFNTKACNKMFQISFKAIHFVFAALHHWQ